MKKIKVNKLNVKRLLIAVAIVLAIAVVCYEINMFSSADIRTQPATATTHKNSVSVKMFAVRDEKLINGSADSTFVPLLQDGERVARGQAIAAQFSRSESASAYVELENLKQELRRYENLNSQQNLNELDMSKLNAQADSYFYDMLDEIRSGNISELDSVSADFVDKQTAKQILINGNIDFSEKISSLKSSIASLTAQIGAVDYLKADDTGYYVSSADGYESVLNFADIENITVDSIKNALSATPATVSENVKGKLVCGYTWYFVGIVDKSTATKLNDGDLITIRCDNASRGEIDAQVYYRGPINSDETVLILSSRVMDEDIARLRVEDVEITISETEGIRVNKSAVRVIDGVQGVYVRVGNIIRFRCLDVIYTGDDYVISRLITENVAVENFTLEDVSSEKDEGNESDEDKKNNTVYYLKIYDEVILKGKDLKHGKLVH